MTGSGGQPAPALACDYLQAAIVAMQLIKKTGRALWPFHASGHAVTIRHPCRLLDFWPIRAGQSLHESLRGIRDASCNL